MSTARRLHHTYAEHTALEDESPIRHEYLHGEIYAMAGGTVELVSVGARLAVDDVYRDGLEDVERAG